ncbi:hypothetical protein, partial [Vibrio parahaemolyticus]|uniref:hypothetical protein n=1 Tax=Vibrio parahaemolyticus TaxID=670 RepID=UPI00211409EC
MAEMMHKKNDKFWKKHCEIQGREASYFDKDFRELFNAMTRHNPEERISIKEIKQSSWYNGAVYTPFEFERKMKQVLKN